MQHGTAQSLTLLMTDILVIGEYIQDHTALEIAKKGIPTVFFRSEPRGAGGWGSIPDRITPKMGGLRFSAWRLSLMS